MEDGLAGSESIREIRYTKTCYRQWVGNAGLARRQTQKYSDEVKEQALEMLKEGLAASNIGEIRYTAA